MRSLEDKITPDCGPGLGVMGFKLSGVLTNERLLLEVTSGVVVVILTSLLLDHRIQYKINRLSLYQNIHIQYLRRITINTTIRLTIIVADDLVNQVT